MNDFDFLTKLCKLVRYDILTSTTEAGSGHPTSALSSVELLVTLFFGGFFHFDLKNPNIIFNDRFVLSKGHASPILYSLYHAAGAISEKELLTLRQFDSDLEGHPTPRFPFVDIATGSLGQGLSAGAGMALGMRLRHSRPDRESADPRFREDDSVLPKVFVLIGDSEFSEGQNYEALQISSHYKLDNLIGILDVNRLGQSGETMLGWDLKTYQQRVESFGWKTILVPDGHNLEKVRLALMDAVHNHGKPTMVIAKTVKGKGVSFLENEEGWHGKALSKDQLGKALSEIGEIDLKIRGTILKPLVIANEVKQSKREKIASSSSTPRNDVLLTYKKGQQISTREAYGDALVSSCQTDPNLIVLDAEVSNSTYSEKIKKTSPEKFLEMFIAEQNMISFALGLSKLGFTPFISTFSAFLTRAFDQIRMSQYSPNQNKYGSGQATANLKLVGSHAGVSIGQDGPSQMGLEDLAMMRNVLNSIVFYPADAVSTAKLVEIMDKEEGLFYLRTTRGKTPVIYDNDEKFEIGGSKILHQSSNDKAIIFTAGITLHETLKAYEELQKQKINITVVDLYCIKPLDKETILRLSAKAKNVIVVEDHYPYGGLGEAVAETLILETGSKKLEKNQNPTSSLKDPASSFQPPVSSFTHLCVRKIPRSGKPEELLAYEEIDSQAIIKAVKK